MQQGIAIHWELGNDIVPFDPLTAVLFKVFKAILNSSIKLNYLSTLTPETVLSTGDLRVKVETNQVIADFEDLKANIPTYHPLSSKPLLGERTRLPCTKVPKNLFESCPKLSEVPSRM